MSGNGYILNVFFSFLQPVNDTAQLHPWGFARTLALNYDVAL